MTHKDQEFIKYCADVMGYELVGYQATYDSYLFRAMLGAQTVHPAYNPDDDLNQMAEVISELAQEYHRQFMYDVEKIIQGEPVIKSFRDFIISTMPEKDND